ncbi:hypothetical protein CR513_31605, partial [Mucuna pruriens]
AKMEADCCEHPPGAPRALNVLSALWLFAMWGIDVISPIEPKASNGYHFIQVAINYFTKWVEAALYVNVTRNDLIYQYGMPSHIITNNETNLNNKLLVELCEQFKI